MVVKIEVMQIKESASPKQFHLRDDKGDLGPVYMEVGDPNKKASKQTLKHYFYKYLSQSGTCQLESA